MSVSVVHTYRNPTRGRLTPLYEVLWALVFILPAAAIVYGSFFDRDAWLLSSPWWPVLLAIVAGCLVWSWPVYESLFRICYLIRVEDQGSCAFRSPSAGSASMRRRSIRYDPAGSSTMRATR